MRKVQALSPFTTAFIYSVFGPFTKNKERTQNFKGTEDSKYRFKIDLSKETINMVTIFHTNSSFYGKTWISIFP